jgi:hypothetical protein
VVVYACDLCTHEAEARELQVQVQPGLLSKTLCKTKQNKTAEITAQRIITSEKQYSTIVFFFMFHIISFYL